MGLELSLDDIRRAWDSRDPDLANLTSVLLAAGGQDVLASKVRPSARRPGQTEEVANSKDTETPVG